MSLLHVTWSHVQGLTRVAFQLCKTLLGSSKFDFNAFKASPGSHAWGKHQVLVKNIKSHQLQVCKYFRLKGNYIQRTLRPVKQNKGKFEKKKKKKKGSDSFLLIKMKIQIKRWGISELWKKKTYIKHEEHVCKIWSQLQVLDEYMLANTHTKKHKNK